MGNPVAMLAAARQALHMRESVMRLLTIAQCVAAVGLFALTSGTATAPVTAAESCIVTNVALHKDRCPPGVAYAGGSSGSVTPDVVVEPVSGPPEANTCIVTNVALHKDRCPTG
jgi:hypothetical protein